MSKKKINWNLLNGTTNFYPTYVDNNRDKVSPTSATYRTEFQKIIPRYDLSMTETRDKGTGPTFLETSYQNPKNINSKTTKSHSKNKNSTENSSKIKTFKKKKIRTDFWH